MAGCRELWSHKSVKIIVSEIVTGWNMLSGTY